MGSAPEVAEKLFRVYGPGECPPPGPSLFVKQQANEPGCEQQDENVPVELFHRLILSHGAPERRSPEEAAGERG